MERELSAKERGKSTRNDGERRVKWCVNAHEKHLEMSAKCAWSERGKSAETPCCQRAKRARKVRANSLQRALFSSLRTRNVSVD